jgi:hypothetical protein
MRLRVAKVDQVPWSRVCSELLRTPNRFELSCRSVERILETLFVFSQSELVLF